MITQSVDITGKHKLLFIEEEKPKKHLYVLDGENVPGATDVKKAYPPSDGLIRYFINQGIEEFKSGKKLKEKAVIGTVMHDYAYHKRLGKLYTLPSGLSSEDLEKIAHRVRLVNKWLDEKKDSLIMAEEIVASPIFKFAGKFDVLVNRNGKVILQDYKSTKGFFEDQFIQLGGYAQALLEWQGITVDGIEVIRFSDDAEEPKSFLIDDKQHIEDFKDQFIRLRETRRFQNVWKTMFDKMYKEEHPYIKK